MTATAKKTPSANADRDALRQDLVARARSLAPKLRERALQAERDRQIPQQSVDEFIAEGLVRTLIPRRWGGHEAGFLAAFEVGIELGRSTCGSSAWCLSYLADHAYLLAHFPLEAQDEVWSANLDATIATSFAPTGQVTVKPGGYALSGKWSWASGIAHSDWIIIGGMLFPEGGHPDLKLFLVPKTDLELVDDWYNAGLRGSGSCSVALDDVFVPEHRTVSMALMRDGGSPGSIVNSGHDYQAPLIAAAPYALLGPAIGLARGAYDDWRGWMRGRVAKYTMAQVSQQNTVQIRLAETAAQIDCADLLIRRNLEVVDTYSPMPIEFRARNRRDFAYGARTIVSAVDGLMTISGASGLFDSNPIQRVWRDTRAISCHVMMNFEAAAENFGRLELGAGLNERDPFF